MLKNLGSETLIKSLPLPDPKLLLEVVHHLLSTLLADLGFHVGVRVLKIVSEDGQYPKT